MPILRAALGLLFFVAVAWALSSHRKQVNLRIVLGSIAMQVLLAVLVLQTGFGRDGLQWFSVRAASFLAMSEEGSRLVFGEGIVPRAAEPDSTTTEEIRSQVREALGVAKDDAASAEDLPPEVLRQKLRNAVGAAPAREPLGFVLAFRALPTIIFFSAFMAIMYHLGVMQFIIFWIARLFTTLLRVSGAEALAMAANVFVGQTEAPLVVRPYIARFTRSELMALMTGGFATIAGSVLAVYMGILSRLGQDFAGHLLAASVMSAPAAFCMAKIMVPETETSETGSTVTLSREKTASNVIEAAAIGTTDGLKLFLNVLAMLIAFTALIAVVNWPLSAIDVGTRMVEGKSVPDPLTLQRIFGWIFAPVAWVMGVEWADCPAFGTLLGVKIGVNEFVAFSEMEASKMSARSLRMAAYALCGFANFASIGIQIGGISPLAPGRRTDLSKLALRAMIGGAMASWMTATIAGAFLDD